MNVAHANETDNRLRELVRAARPTPPVPPDFAHAVWLRIAEADTPAEATWAWLERLADLLIRPRVAFAGLTVLIVISAAAGAADGAAAAREAALQRYIAAVAPPMEH